MKKIFTIVVFVSFVIGIIVSINSKSTVIESTLEKNSPNFSSPLRQEIQKNSGKVLAVMPQDYKKEAPKKREP